MEDYKQSIFEDPFAGTPKAATRRSYGVDTIKSLEKLRKGIVFTENGLMGMKDVEGNVIYPPQYTLIAKCIDYVFFLDPKGGYEKVAPGVYESGYMKEEERPYVEQGKVGFKVDGKVVIPPVYDYVKPVFGGETFYAEKDGKFMYLDMNGKEVLTRIRWFEGEDHNESPLYLCTDEFDRFTTMKYVGHNDPDNPNMITMGGEYVELERYDKDEILGMMIDPNDDLALTEKELSLLLNDFSYEFCIYFANARGKRPLDECMRQFKQMDALNSTWFHVVKLWQAPGEHVGAKDLRDFCNAMGRANQLGHLVIAVGHDKELKPGEVRMMLITHYNERSWPADFEFEWGDKVQTQSIKDLMAGVPELKKNVEETVMEKYREQVYLDQIRSVIGELKYDPSLSWEELDSILDFFYQQGSPCTFAVKTFLKKAEKNVSAKNLQAVDFYLHAVLWALRHGAIVNGSDHKQSSLDIIKRLSENPDLTPIINTVREVESKLIQRGGKTKVELEHEINTNNDYFKELDRMRVIGNVKGVY